MLELGIKTLISYLIGSINGSILLGRLQGVDVRKFGSGNPGATNALRAKGMWFALGVAIIDVAKGLVPTAWLPGAIVFGLAIDPAVSREWLIVACAAAAVIGHCYPVWHRFGGGKGAATAVGALAVIEWPLVPIGIAFWALVLVVTGYVGIATMSVFVVAPFIYLVFFDGALMQVLALLGFLAVFIVFTHRSNVRRLLDGTEHRMVRARFWKRG